MRDSSSSGGGITALGRTPCILGAVGAGARNGVCAPPGGPGTIVGAVTRSTSIAFKGGWRVTGWVMPHHRAIRTTTMCSRNEPVRPARFSCQRLRAVWIMVLAIIADHGRLALAKGDAYSAGETG